MLCELNKRSQRKEGTMRSFLLESHIYKDINLKLENYFWQKMKTITIQMFPALGYNLQSCPLNFWKCSVAISTPTYPMCSYCHLCCGACWLLLESSHHLLTLCLIHWLKRQLLSCVQTTIANVYVNTGREGCLHPPVLQRTGGAFHLAIGFL